jgi:hypothetical protein
MRPRVAGMRRCPECGLRSVGGYEHTLECSLSQAAALHQFGDMAEPVADAEEPYVITIACSRCFERSGQESCLAILQRRTEYRRLGPPIHTSFRDRWYANWYLVPTQLVRDSQGRRSVPAPLPGPATPNRTASLHCARCGYAPRVNTEQILDLADQWRDEGRVIAFV